MVYIRRQSRRDQQFATDSMVITFSHETPRSLRPGALGYAHPLEGTHIVVFYDRVKDQAGRSVPSVLGHVIAHEVAHILQGVARHSESGIMKATWTRMDYQQMSWEPLQFTDEDVMLIRRRLDHSSQDAYR